MRLNSNEIRQARPVKHLSEEAGQHHLAFVSAYLQLKHHLLLNACISSVAMMVEEPDQLLIREIESEEEVLSMQSERSFQRFTDEEDNSMSQSDEELEGDTNMEKDSISKPSHDTRQPFDSLRQTAHFSNEGDESQNKPNHQNKQLSVKERLMHKLLAQKERLTGKPMPNDHRESAFNKTLPTTVHYERPSHEKPKPAQVKKEPFRQTVTRTTRVIFEPATKNQSTGGSKQRPFNLR